jgi:hypothetical protein
VFLIGVVVTLLSWDVTRNLAGQTEARRFEYRTIRVVGDLRHALEADEVLLRSVAALFSVGGGHQPRAVARLLQRDGNGTRSPGRLWLAFAQRVPAADLQTHERLARADGLAPMACAPMRSTPSTTRSPISARSARRTGARSAWTCRRTRSRAKR